MDAPAAYQPQTTQQTAPAPTTATTTATHTGNVGDIPVLLHTVNPAESLRYTPDTLTHLHTRFYKAVRLTITCRGGHHPSHRRTMFDAPNTHDAPQRRRDRANKHQCDATGTVVYAREDQCGYCND